MEDYLASCLKCKFPRDSDDNGGWGYNWERVKYGTLSPTPRDGYATLFVVVNHTDSPLDDFKNFIHAINHNNLRNTDQRLELEIKDQYASPGRQNFVLTLGETRIHGNLSIDLEHVDPNLGYYGVMGSTSVKGYMLLQMMKQCTSHGYACLLEHVESSIDLDETLKLGTVTGLGPTFDDDLSTRFVLKLNDSIDVAKCHLSYRDGSNPALIVGPTIEMISVQKNYHNRSYLPVLFYWVTKFVEENFTLECFSNNSPPGKIQLKALLSNDRNVVVDSHQGRNITAQEFFLDYAAFSMVSFQGSIVLNLSLPSRKYLKEGERTYLGSNNIAWKVNIGRCACDHCQKIKGGMKRCQRCLMVHYCSRKCQKQDWKRHKEWCGKTKLQLKHLLENYAM